MTARSHRCHCQLKIIPGWQGRGVASLTIPCEQEFTFLKFPSFVLFFSSNFSSFLSSCWPSGWMTCPPGKVLAMPLNHTDWIHLIHIGELAVVAFWWSPHGPLDSGPPKAGYSQRRKRKEKGERAALIFLPRPVWEPSPPLLIHTASVCPSSATGVWWNKSHYLRMMVHFITCGSSIEHWASCHSIRC